MVIRNPLTTSRLIYTILFVESCVSLPVFFVSWMACSVYQAIVAGWEMSKIDSEGKRSALTKVINS